MSSSASDVAMESGELLGAKNNGNKRGLGGEAAITNAPTPNTNGHADANAEGMESPTTGDGSSSTNSTAGSGGVATPGDKKEGAEAMDVSTRSAGGGMATRFSDRKRRSTTTAAPPPTPASAMGTRSRQRKQELKGEEPQQPQQERQEEEADGKTPQQGMTTRKRSSASSSANNVATPTGSGDASSAKRSRVASGSANVTGSGSRGSRRKAVVISLDNDEADATLSAGTPNVDGSGSKGGSRARGSRGSMGRVARAKKAEKDEEEDEEEDEAGDDVFGFDANKDNHPEPLKNISMERQQFGAVKFTKSSPSSGENQYAGLERSLQGRSSGGGGGAASTSMGNNTSLNLSQQSNSLMLSSSSAQLSGITTPGTTGSRGGRAGQRGSTLTLAKLGGGSGGNDFKFNPTDEVGAEEAGEEPMGEEDEVGATRGSTTARGGARGRGRRGAKSTSPVKVFAKPVVARNKATTEPRPRRPATSTAATSSATPKKPEEELYKVPQLSRGEQYEVDHPDEHAQVDHHHQVLQPGARVMALYGTDYYPAIVCGRDGLGRYYIHYVEDGMEKELPPTGVLPLTALVEGTMVSYSAELGEDAIGKTATIVATPVAGNPDSWWDGIYSVQEVAEGTPKRGSSQQQQQQATGAIGKVDRIEWTRIYLSKAQRAKITAVKSTSFTVMIDEENITTDSRSSRRSRASLVQTPQQQQQGSEESGTPLAASQSSSRRASGRTRTPANTSTKSNADSSKRQSRTSSPPSTQRRGSGRGRSSAKGGEAAGSPATGSVGGRASGAYNEQASMPPLAGGELDNGGSQPVIAADNDYADDEQPPCPPTISQQPPSHQQLQQQQQGVADSSMMHPTSSGSSAIAISALPPPASDDERGIFGGMLFVLTSATRGGAPKQTNFNKREYREKIEQRGGTIIDNFNNLAEGQRAFLIADTYYRTHKYLSALSLSIPCVKHDWILECVKEKRLVDYATYMLPAGESILNPSVIFPWQPLKGTLLRGKRAWVYSRVQPPPGAENALNFIDIWSPIVANLGGELVNANMAQSDFSTKLQFCADGRIDYLITDANCEQLLAVRVEAEGGQAVSSEWVIQAIVTGDLPNVEDSARFHYDYVVAPAVQPRPQLAAPQQMPLQ